jgi:superfamily II DNA/RNA helicase
VVPLDLEFTPTTSAEEREKFMHDNEIKFVGASAPPAALTWAELPFPDPVRRQIARNSWPAPTPIQSVAIPVALKGQDLIGIAKTGSGKTAAFVIPGLIHITRQEPLHPGDGPIVLVISPTRELAQQTSQVCQDFASAMGIHQCCIFGGASISGQAAELRKSPAFVVACPGRMNDFLERGNVTMDRVSFLVLDEADRLLDMGFEEQIRRIIGKTAAVRQTLMFSATWPKAVRQLANDFLKDPVHMIIGSSELTTNSSIRQIIEKVEEYEKLSRCVAFLDAHRRDKVIIFTKTKRSADDLADNLSSKSMSARALHGDKSQATRDYVLSEFRRAKTGILVATDVAARGLDVDDVDIVVNFDFPGDIESYIHRIGRTARGTKSGVAFSFFTEENRNLSRKLAKVLKQAQQEIPEWLAKIADATPRGASKQGAYGRYGPRSGGGGGGFDRRDSRGGGYHGGGYGGGGGGYGGQYQPPPPYGGYGGYAAPPPYRY